MTHAIRTIKVTAQCRAFLEELVRRNPKILVEPCRDLDNFARAMGISPEDLTEFLLEINTNHSVEVTFGPERA